MNKEPPKIIYHFNDEGPSLSEILKESFRVYLRRVLRDEHDAGT